MHDFSLPVVAFKLILTIGRNCFSKDSIISLIYKSPSNSNISLAKSLVKCPISFTCALRLNLGFAIASFNEGINISFSKISLYDVNKASSTIGPASRKRNNKITIWLGVIELF